MKDSRLFFKNTNRTIGNSTKLQETPICNSRLKIKDTTCFFKTKYASQSLKNLCKKKRLTQERKRTINNYLLQEHGILP